MNQSHNEEAMGKWGRTRRVPALMVAALLGVALIGAACSSSPSSSDGASNTATTTGSSGGSASGTALTIKNFVFTPATLTVKPGATVTVTNKDGVAHTVTSTDNKFSTGNINPNQSKTFTAPTTAGTYAYICSIHPYMKGTIVVT